MQSRYRILILVFLVFLNPMDLGAQSIYHQLCARCTSANTDSAKVESLSDLARYFYALREDVRGDSVLDMAEMVAEESRSPALKTKIYVDCPRYLLLGSTFRSRFILSKEDADKTLSCINKSLDYLRSLKADDKTALAYSTLSLFYEVNGQLNEAFKYANLANTTALAVKNDSVKVICALQLGHIYYKQRDVVLAYKTYTAALDISLDNNNQYLQALIYKYFAQLYLSLHKHKEAKEYLYRCLDINKANHYYYDLIDTYILLADDDDFNIVKANLSKAEALADSIGDISSKIEVQRHFLNHMMLINQVEALSYLHTHNDLKNTLDRYGSNYLDWMIGEIYYYGGNADSALLYYINAETSFDKIHNVEVKRRFFEELAFCYNAKNNRLKAIQTYEKALGYAKITSAIGAIINYTNTLKDLYQREGNYETAFQYYDQYARYKDTMNIYAKERDLALLEIDNFNKKKLRDEEAAKVAEERRHNLQYMAITVCIISVFMLLMVLGAFTVSRTMIKILGFFSFIFFFEFITLLADNKIHHWTHGEPMYVWLIKIVLLAGLLPLHHWLEEKLVHYLVSNKLIELRQKLAIGHKLAAVFVNGKKKGGDKTPPAA